MTLSNAIEFYWTYFFEREKLVPLKGKCKKCGKCCTFLSMTKCPFLNKENRCMIYRFRPPHCRLSPSDSGTTIEKHEGLGCSITNKEVNQSHNNQKNKPSEVSGNSSHD